MPSLQSNILLQAVAFFLHSLLAASCVAESRKPNVLFIISDDLNVALSGMGHPECKTPHLDKFAESGVTFSRAYCQFPLCSPSRASIMSGQYPLVNGVKGNGGSVDPDRVTLPRHFANHGYWTARVSKIYHMGIPSAIVEGTPGKDHEASWAYTYNVKALEALTPGKAVDFLKPENTLKYPEERKKWFTANSTGSTYKFSSVARAQYASIEVADKNNHLLADTIATNKAIELLRSRKGQEQPFFLAVGLVRPHFPFIATEKAMGQYHASSLTIPEVPENDLTDVPTQASNSVLHFDESPLQQMRRAYYGAISYMDEQVGRLLAELDNLELRNDTIVVFVSDHGYLLGEHFMWKKAKLWEEAIHVPLIISVPKGGRGSSCEGFVELVDLYPTLADLAGLPADPGAQGHSLVKLLQNPEQKLDRNDAFIQVANGYCLRTDRWAYMWYPKSSAKKEEGFMLYDMDRDPEQYKNLAGKEEFSAIQLQLHERLVLRIAASKG